MPPQRPRRGTGCGSRKGGRRVGSAGAERRDDAPRTRRRTPPGPWASPAGPASRISSSVQSRSTWNTFIVNSPRRERDSETLLEYLREKSTKKMWVVVISAKNHTCQRRKRQSVTTKREKSQTPKFLTAILTLPNLT